MSFSELFDGKIAPEDDYYYILGCRESATTEQIAAEYRVRAKQYHPDRQTDRTSTDQSSEPFLRLNKAYEVLSDDKKRKQYDSWKHSGLTISFEKWLATQERRGESFHFAVKKEQTSISDRPNVEPSMAGHTSQDNHMTVNDFRASGHKDSLISRFRSYNI